MGIAAQFATAALYAALAAVLLALVHRKLVPLSRRAALALALLPLCFTGRALATGRVYAPIDLAYSSQPLASFAAEYGVDGKRRGILTDVYSANIPWRQAVRHAIGEGEWPLWNPFILCGDPLAGTAQPAPYYPINLLSLLLPVALGFTFGASAQLFAGALAAFLYLRDLGCRESAALFGAVGWTFASFNAFWLEWPLGAAVSLAPLVLFATRRLVARPGWPTAAFLAGALALVVLAGHPESAVHVVGLGAVVGIVETAVAPRRRWGPIAGWTLAAGALALAATAVYLLPVVEVLRQTVQWVLRQRSTNLSAAVPAAEAFRRLVASAVPPVLDLPRSDPAPPLYMPLASAYAGSVLWGPALYGLVRGPRRNRRDRLTLGAIGLVSLCAGARMPGIYPLIGRLPLFSASLNERLVFGGALATAFLAALGVDAWLQAAERGESRRAARELALAVVVAAAVFGLAAARLVPTARAYGYAAPTLARWELWALAPLAALFLALALPAAGGLPRSARSARWLGWAAAALVALLAVQRTGEMGSFYPTVPAGAFYPRVPPVDALPPPSDEPWRLAGLDFQLIPNQSIFYGAEDARGYQALLHMRFAELLRLWADPLPSWFLAVRNLGRPYLSLVNVRYALTPRYAHPPGWRQVAKGPGARLWENPRALPRAFVPRQVRLAVPPDREVEEMAGETDFGARAWIAPPGGDGGPPREERNGRGWVIARRRGLGLVLTARMKQAGWAVVTETAWTGWRARLDGREVPLGVGDHAFLALAIPEGWHTAELFYRPRSFEIGLALSTVTLLLAAVASLARARRRGPVAAGSPDGPPSAILSSLESTEDRGAA